MKPIIANEEPTVATLSNRPSTDAGLGIVVVGKPVDGDERVETMIFKLGDVVSCSRVVPCPHVENPDNLIIECEKDLR